MSGKLLWNTVVIKVPSEFITVDKNGKIKIAPPLTKSKGISKRNGKPAINIVPSDVNKVVIENDGDFQNAPPQNKTARIRQPKVQNTDASESMHERMARLRAMRKKKV